MSFITSSSPDWPQVPNTDRRSWRLGTNCGYSVCSVYHMLTTDDSQVLDAVSKLIWHIHVPVKVSLPAW
ncbi:hypothetical protein MtrunA17_Chr2g0322381 [Medicago truncatula]|uniref:Uncharacterized protein n=1 Tax=Medicago truncatula TaxID=3880 RepID=A0A072VLI1_MEDTR|nr:hypothetical protein MTR_2g087985 [Medicago truncatula]RHN75542.1 hypothetical protein MtrunA17_Chr2g0322381 [Medicago truncatula]